MSITDAIIKKLAKKTKIGEYDPNDVVEALNVVDPGWTIKSITTTMQAGSYSNQHDRFETLWSGRLGVALASNEFADVSFADVPKGVNPVRLGADYFRISFKKGAAEDDKLVKDVIARVSKPLIMGAPPAKPVVDGLYVAGLKVEHEFDGYRVTVQKARLGVPGFLITSPSGAKLELPVQPLSGARPGNPAKMSAAALWTWLYKETDAAAKAAAYLDTPEAREVQQHRDRAKQVGSNAGKVGVCPVCERLQKLSWNRKSKDGHPTMVLHGYERPGYGYIVGDCFGVGYPPWELSPEGAEAWLKELRVFLKSAKNVLVTAKGAKSLFVWVSPDLSSDKEETELFANGTFKTTNERASDKDLRRRGESYYGKDKLERDGKGLFNRLKAAAVESAELKIERISNDIKKFETKIAGWKAQPLAGTSEEDQKYVEEAKSGQCPGSGTTNHDSAHVARNLRFKWAHCNVCGQQVTVTSTGKLRAHPYVKASASARIDAITETLAPVAAVRVKLALEEAADLLAE